MKRIDFERIEEENYLYNTCEFLYNKYFSIEDKQELKSFEREIWMIGSEIIENIRKTKKKVFTDTLLRELLKIINQCKYGRGRESFVMLLHYFKKNPNIEIYLASLLDDEQLYAFAIGELTKLKLFAYTDKVQEILSKEKISWRKKEAKKYIEKSKNR